MECFFASCAFLEKQSLLKDVSDGPNEKSAAVVVGQQTVTSVACSLLRAPARIDHYESITLRTQQ